MGAAIAVPVPVDEWPYKMRDLCRLAGMPRQAIHFYIQQGLIPPGHKTGRNTARYGAVHVERIRVVRELQSERFMPLKAIRAVLDGRDDVFTPSQRALLLEVKGRLASTLARPAAGRPGADARALLVRHGLDRRDLDDLIGARVIEVERTARGKLRVRADDEWAFELLGKVRRAGFSRTLGFDAKLLRIYARAVASLVDREKRVITERLVGVAPEQVAGMLEKAMPLVDEFFARYHANLVRDFFASMEN